MLIFRKWMRRHEEKVQMVRLNLIVRSICIVFMIDIFLVSSASAGSKAPSSHEDGENRIFTFSNVLRSPNISGSTEDTSEERELIDRQYQEWKELKVLNSCPKQCQTQAQ